MKNDSAGKNITLIGAWLFLIVPVFVQFLWIIIWHSNRFVTPDEKSKYFLNLFPSFLQNQTTISLIAFLFCLTALILGALSIDKVNKKIRWLAFATVLVSFITGLLYLARIM